MPALKHTEATKAKMSAAWKRKWEDPIYAREQHQRRIDRKVQQLQGAFSTNPLYEPAIDEFDRWEY